MCVTSLGDVIASGMQMLVMPLSGQPQNNFAPHAPQVNQINVLSTISLLSTVTSESKEKNMSTDCNIRVAVRVRPLKGERIPFLWILKPLNS